MKTVQPIRDKKKIAMVTALAQKRVKTKRQQKRRSPHI